MPDADATSSPAAVVTVDRKELLAELTHAARTAARRTKIPLLSHLSLRAGNGRLEVAATDLDVTLSVWLPAEVEGEAALAVSARDVLNIVKSSDPGDVRLRLYAPTDRAPSLGISSGAARWRLRALGADKFPKVPTVEGDAPSAEIDGNILRRMLAMTTFAISTEQSRFQLNGALVGIGGGALRIVATDGHRLPLAEAAHSGEVAPTLIRSRALAEAAKLAGKSGEPWLYRRGAAALSLSSGRRVLTVRSLDGVFPDYERVIARDLPVTITTDRRALSRAVARMQQVAEGKYNRYRSCVVVRLKASTLELSAISADSGESAEDVAVERDGPPEDVLFGLQPNYFQAALAAVETDRVRISLKDGASQLIFRPDGASDVRYLCVVMPMTTEELPPAIKW
jgi:DNA polymerase-3 subunit beta